MLARLLYFTGARFRKTAMAAPKPCLCSSRTATDLLVLCFLLLHVYFHHATALSFSYDSFSLDDFKPEADAMITAGRIELLGDEAGGRARGRALYKQAVQLWDRVTGEAASFNATFNFSIQSLPNRSSNAGHGMTFFLAPYPSYLPQDSYDGCLGLFSESLVRTDGATTLSANASGDARFLAVEFDTYRDDWDPSSRHIGVDVNNVNSRGNYKILPNDSLVDAGVMSATVSYDNATTRLDVVLSGGASGASYTLAATVDLRSILPPQVTVGFSAATGDVFGSKHTVLSCSFQSTLPTRNDNTSLPSTSSNKKATVQLIAGVAAAAAVLVLLLIVAVGVLLRRASRRNDQSEEKDMFAGDMTPDSLDMDKDDEFGSSTGPRPIPYADLAAATSNFSEDGKLGQGGSGSVYRGHMKQLGGRDVAIKVFLRGASTEGRKEYRSEVTIISRLRHRNLVQLIGWCHGRRRLLLVYELVHNGSLDGYLYSKQETALTWQVRYQIIVGLASAVLYLHQEWDQCVVHGDIKPSNIMLDESFNAKLGDFGLARLIDHGVSLQTMTAMAGTPGYLDPECIITGKASTESDVYSFGITLLEIACGRRPMAPPSAGAKDSQVFRLLEWAWDLYGRGAALDAADARLGGAFDQWEMERVVAVGLWSAHPDPKMRPAIRQAAEALQSRKFRMPVLPPKMPVAVYLQPFGASSMEYGDTTTTVGSGVTMQYSSTATQSSNSSVPAAVGEQLSPRV
ncbi:L-type lectin-domain containing receptor kinase IX.1-like [Lolium rigidum]|uniref:L-type lectin-domain containing receptor kinase IX.1-like n=1 Tax=Lolium rigidum TaxID=89674 RepID=UPI001F5DE6FF|nr:L-type lectin-domain containing receptor kinase IX.1-like [Lolium rigidum]